MNSIDEEYTEVKEIKEVKDAFKQKYLNWKDPMITIGSRVVSNIVAQN